MAGEPDWSVSSDRPSEAVTPQQRQLLEEIEEAISTPGSRQPDPETVMQQLRPLVLALRASGLSARRIADNSRIRPDGVERLLADN